MKKLNRILVCICCIALLVISWMMVLSEKSDLQVQQELIAEAKVLMEDKIYVRAEPLLTEAAGYNESAREEAEELLKEVYTALIDVSGYSSKLTKLIDRQVARPDSSVEVYTDAADYYLAKGKITKAIAALRTGVEHTGDESLYERYEQERYAIDYCGYEYEDATEIYNGKLQVRSMDLWGLCDLSGELVIPCEYEKISTFSNNSAVVRKAGEIYVVNDSALRIYLLHSEARDFGNFGNNLLGLQTEDGWVRATGEMQVGSMTFEALGMYTDGYAAAKQNGKWGVIDRDAEWKIDPIYDEVVMDSLGRCWAQNAVFVRDGQSFYLVTGGSRMDTAYDDVRPFNEEGWAAVKSDGQWKFIDTSGQVQLECGYSNVKSFSGHLAAVEVDGLWGYISSDGRLVIDAEYQDAGSFSEGSAPVQMDGNWTLIMLHEYQED